MSFPNFLQLTAITTLNIRPIEIVGDCPAGLTLEDEFQIEGMRLANPNDSTICFLDISQPPIGQGIWQLQCGERFFSHVTCPGCSLSSEHENRVVFLFGHADKWKLCRLISEYLTLSKQHGETELSRRAKVEAIQYQNRGEYLEATQQMERALQELRRIAG